MARPTIESKIPQFQNKHTGGRYKITYQAPAGARRLGVPHDDKTDIINLQLVVAHGDAPAFIVTSLFDFEENFEVYNPIQTDKPESNAKEVLNPII